MRASGPSFMKMPPLTLGSWPLLSHLPWLLSGNTVGWGRGLERALRKERGHVGERGAVWQTQKLLGTSLVVSGDSGRCWPQGLKSRLEQTN